MFRTPTVFVIGAGAGFDIDMCLGETLMEQIQKDVNFRTQGTASLSSGSDALAHALSVYAARNNLDRNTFFAAGRSIATGIGYAGSIDNYIHNHRKNEAVKTVGKMAIVKVILEYEKRSSVFIDETKSPRKFRDVTKLQRSWLYSFMRILGDGVVVGETLDNIFKNVAVVTFNYDRCLEQFLCQAIQERFGVNAATAQALMSKLDILHAYGQIAPLNWQSSDGVHFGGDPYGNDLDLAALSENIRTYNEEVEENDHLRKIHERICWAKRLVFLGFHFHDQNVDLITPKEMQEKTALKHAFATVLGRSGPEIERIGSQIRQILSPTSSVTSDNFEKGGCKELFSTWGTTLAH